MGKRDVIDIIQRFKASLARQGLHDLRVILFGSWAKGTAHEYSDIDLVVISSDFEGKDYWDRLSYTSQAIYEIFEPIEAFALTPKEWEAKEKTVCMFAANGEEV